MTPIDPEWSCHRKKGHYPSEKVAHVHRRKVEQIFGRKMRVYHCPHCGEWHLATVREE